MSGSSTREQRGCELVEVFRAPVALKAHRRTRMRKLLQKMFEAADQGMHAEAARGDRLASALRGMLQLDEENHQRYPGDEDMCQEVREARSALMEDGNRFRQTAAQAPAAAGDAPSAARSTSMQQRALYAECM